MLIRMNQTAAGPSGVFAAGNIYDVPAPFGHGLVTSGAAEIVGRKPVETASVEASPERAVTADATRHGKRRGRRR